jgi:hypothetical protein
LLDAFIIDRIQREREAAQGSFLPLRIDVPLPPPRVEPVDPRPEEGEERGIAEIDFSI